MVNAGFNPLKIISEQTGKSLADLKEEMSKGQISFDMVKKAFQDAVGPGGKFNGLLKEMANTTAGRLTRLTSALQEAGIAMGEFVKPVMDGALGYYTSELQSMTRTMQQLSAAMPKSKGASDSTFLGAAGDVAGSGMWTGLSRLYSAISFGLAKVHDDAEAAREAFDHLKGSTQSLYKMIESDPILQVRPTEELKSRAKAGLELTEQEQRFLELLNQRERAERKVWSSTALRYATEHEQRTSMLASEEERMQAFVEFVDKIGKGYLTDEQLSTYDQYAQKLRAITEESDKLRKSQERISGAFGEVTAKIKEQISESKYGKDTYTALSALRGSVSPGLQGVMDASMDVGAPADRVVSRLRLRAAMIGEDVKAAIAAYEKLRQLQAEKSALDEKEARRKEQERAKNAKTKSDVEKQPTRSRS